MKISTVFLVIVLAVVACTEEPVTQTAADAVEFGFEPVECDDGERATVYAKTDSLDNVKACAAFNRAVRWVLQSGLLPSRVLAADSIVLAVVERRLFADLPSPPAVPDTGIVVTIDLRNRQHNIYVSWPGILDSRVDVTWVPEGLKY